MKSPTTSAGRWAAEWPGTDLLNDLWWESNKDCPNEQRATRVPTFAAATFKLGHYRLESKEQTIG
jgi:hypothetical protein